VSVVVLVAGFAIGGAVVVVVQRATVTTKKRVVVSAAVPGANVVARGFVAEPSCPVSFPERPPSGGSLFFLKK
jgi:hypothetical protein